MKCDTCRKAEVLDTLWDKIRLFFFKKFTRDLEDFRMDYYTQGISEGYKRGFEQADKLGKEQFELFKQQTELSEREKANLFLKNLYCTVDENDIMTILEGKDGKARQIYIGKELITPNEYQNIVSEIKFVKETRLWKIMTSSLSEAAKLRMFEQSKCDADMLFGKAMLFTIDIQKKLLSKIESFRPQV